MAPNHSPVFVNTTLVLALLVFVLAASLALLAAAWFMVAQLLLPNQLVPANWSGFVRV